MRRLLRGLAVLAGIVLLPAAALAQGTLTGTAKDTSGAVLPGVTVEAASPALIEKVRTVVTDGTGQYRIIDLRPGTYTVTFTLSGFNTVKREAVELSGSAVVSINADMKVGAVEETITVTGETPIVDTQSTTKERVLTQELINTLPTGRMYQSLGSLVPGVTGGNTNENIGGIGGDQMVNLSAHGVGDMRVTNNGVTTATLQAGGSIGMATPNPNAAQEVTIDTGSVDASLATGGVRINFIPRDGGNSFKLTNFFAYGNEHLQNDNYTNSIGKAQGLSAAGGLRRNWDFNPAFGGPVVKDKVWYWVTIRHQLDDNYVANMFYNANANVANDNTAFQTPFGTMLNLRPDLQGKIPQQYVYNCQPSSAGCTTTRAYSSYKSSDAQVRVTWQASPRIKLAGTWDQQSRCECIDGGSLSATRSPEASFDRRSPTQRLLHGEATIPVTSRLLFEVVALHRTERWGNMPPGIEGFLSGSAPGAITVTDQGSNLGQLTNGVSIRGTATYNNNWVPNYFYRMAVSYVTGAHSFKAGFNDAPGYLQTNSYQYQNLAYRFNSTTLQGCQNSNPQCATGHIPNQLTEYAQNPFTIKHDQDHDLGIFAQDRWTLKRATVTAGIRYDWFKNSYPDQRIGPAILAPTRDLNCANTPTFCAHDNLNWKDIEPRFGVVYDLFGNGKTAARFSANKYLAGQALNGLASSSNPASTLSTNTTRVWTDKNDDFIPNCDLANSAANGECGAWGQSNFGGITPISFVDANVLQGWNKRNNHWEFSVGVQQQILPRLSVDFAWFHQVFANFTGTDNMLITPADYTFYSVTAPVDARLGDISGTVLPGLFTDRNGSSGTSSSNCTVLLEGNSGHTLPTSGFLNGQPCGTSASYGARTQHWDGADVTVNARLRNGLTAQGGMSFGRTFTNNCNVTIDDPGHRDCDIPPDMFRPSFKANGTYTVPKVLVQVSGTFISNPGGGISATYSANCTTETSLGHNCGVNTTNTSVNLLRPNTLYFERLNQIDLRFGKIVKINRARAVFNIDLYNALNADTPLGRSSTFNLTTPSFTAGGWQAPSSMLIARFIKLGVQFDF